METEAARDDIEMKRNFEERSTKECKHKNRSANNYKKESATHEVSVAGGNAVNKEELEEQKKRMKGLEYANKLHLYQLEEADKKEIYLNKGIRNSQ